MKLKINTKLYLGKEQVSHFENLKAIYNEKHELIFNENKNKMKIRINGRQLRRENQEFIFTINENEVSLYIKELQNYVNIKLEKFKFIKEGRKISIAYKINTENKMFKYLIMMEEYNERKNC